MVSERKYPNRLIKFIPDNEFLIPTLENGEMLFSYSSKFNDPFDSNFSIENPTESKKKKYISYLVKEKGPKDKSEKIRFKKELRKIFSDPKKIIELSEEGKGNFRERTAVLSLSHCSNHDNILMWSHYTNSHKGVCLEIDFEYDKYPIYEVCYSIDRPEYPFFSIDIRQKPEVLEKILSTKSDVWKYEKEYRFIDVTDYVPIDRKLLHIVFRGLNLSGRVNDIGKKYSGFKIRKVYLGANFDEGNMGKSFDKIKEICKKNDIECIQYRLNHKHYKLVPNVITL